VHEPRRRDFRRSGCLGAHGRFLPGLAPPRPCAPPHGTHAHPWWTRCWSSRSSRPARLHQEKIEARFRPVVLRSILPNDRDHYARWTHTMKGILARWITKVRVTHDNQQSLRATTRQ
jgi:hypothetical protein